MLKFCRPAFGRTVDKFTEQYIAPLPGAFADKWGNWHVKIGESRILWSSHTDTVHDKGGRQKVDRRGNRFQLPADSKSRCLGADDTAGVWLMVNMIRAGKPGYYIFHDAEEVGAVGSRNLAKVHGDWLRESFDAAIALDRRGFRDVITHQGSWRTASDAFAESLCLGLGMKHKPCKNGIFTDTREYAHLIPECTNVSVGYEGAHSNRETLDGAHLARLLDRLLDLDTDTLIIERDAEDEDDFETWYREMRAEAKALDKARDNRWDSMPLWARDCPQCGCPSHDHNAQGSCLYCRLDCEFDPEDRPSRRGIIREGLDDVPF
jgi:hypothetical protein